MSKVEQSASGANRSERDTIGKYLEQISSFPLLTTQEQTEHAKRFSCQEIAGYLLEDLQTGIGEGKRQLTHPDYRVNGKNKKFQTNPILSKEVAEVLLEELGLTEKIKLEFYEGETFEETEKAKKSDRDRKPLTDEEKEQRKAVIGYQWIDEASRPRNKSKILKRLDEYLKDADKAREAMINSNLRLVVSTAKKRSSSLELEELIEAGNFGLIRAVDKFDYRKGYEFSTYATSWIKNKIQRQLHEDSPLRIPEDLRNVVDAAEKLANNYEIEHAQRPTIEVLTRMIEAKNMKTNPSYVKRAAHLLLSGDMNPVHLDQQGGENGDLCLKDIIPDTVDMDETVQAKLISDALANSLSRLTDIEKQVIGLCFWEDMSDQRIESKLGIPRLRVRKIITDIIQRLREDQELSRYQDSDNSLSSGEAIQVFPTPKAA